MTLSLDAAVVNYRTPDELLGFAEAWVQHAPPWSSLTVVNVDPLAGDVAAGEQAVSMLAVAGLPVTYQSHDLNIGYARACNHAVRDSTADVLALFNADTRITAGLIEELCEAMQQHPDWGVVGPRQVDDRGRITHGGILGSHSAPVQRGWHQLDQGQYGDIVTDAVSVMGAAFFVRRDCWQELTDCPIYRKMFPEAVGAFMPVPRFYYEDTACAYHAAAHNWRVVYYGPVSMVHRWHKSISQLDDGGRGAFFESQAIFRAFCDAHGIDHD